MAGPNESIQIHQQNTKVSITVKIYLTSHFCRFNLILASFLNN